MTTKSPVDPTGEPFRWLTRIAAIIAVLLLLMALFGVLEERLRAALWAIPAAAAIGALAVAGTWRSSTRRGLGVAVGVGAFLITLSWFQFFGSSYHLAAGVLAPLVVASAMALGPASGFLVADGSVLVWAICVGLSSGGLLGWGPALAHGPERTLLELGGAALLLNAVALVSSWGLEQSDPEARAELERTREENERLGAQLDSVSPLASVGRLIANVAHEISNPLQAIDNILFVVLGETPEEDERRARLVMLKQGVDRITEYVDQLSEFYRPSREVGPVAVDQVISDVFRFLDRQLENANVKVNQEFEPGLPPVRIDETSLRQVVLNVVLNAAEAMPDGGDIRISAAREGEGVALVVEDTGPGIPEEDLERIFEPFFTTRRDQGGTGLGLSISKRIMRGHGGEILARSRPGSGTRMILRLPGMVDSG